MSNANDFYRAARSTVVINFLNRMMIRNGEGVNTTILRVIISQHSFHVYRITGSCRTLGVRNKKLRDDAFPHTSASRNASH